MRPPTCGVTVTDSKAIFLPISSRYFGTSCDVAFTTVTSGGGIVGAACTFCLLQPAMSNSAADAVNAKSFLRRTAVLSAEYMPNPRCKKFSYYGNVANRGTDSTFIANAATSCGTRSPEQVR